MRAPLEYASREAEIGLLVAVQSADPVRHADMAARVALAGHTLVELNQADIVLTDGPAFVAEGLPILRLSGSGDGSVLPPDLSARQLDAGLRAVVAGLRVTAPAPAHPAPVPLTPREVEILGRLGDGLSNKGVARALGISAHTVKFHLEAVFAKLGAASRAEAVAKGLRQGLIVL